jgi:cell wall assembly regulator SMI1
MAEALRRFEAALAAHAPDTLAALQPGLSAEQISELERRFHLRLTAEMRALYSWRNGSSEAGAELVTGHRFVPLEEAAMSRLTLRSQAAGAPLIPRAAFAVFAGHRAGWLTLLDDRCGDRYFYDPGRRRRGGSFFYHFAEDSQYIYFASLRNFLVGAAECYEGGIYRVGGGRGMREDFERAFDIWSRYASS